MPQLFFQNVTKVISFVNLFRLSYMNQPKIASWNIFLRTLKAILTLFIPVLAFSSVFAGPAVNSSAATANPTPTSTSSAAPSPNPTSTKSSWIVGKPFWMQSGVTVTVDPHLHSYSKGDSIWVLVNKHRPLKPVTYKPEIAKPDFANPKQSNPLGYVLRPEAAAALAQMDRDMMKGGYGRIVLASGYRSYNTQTAIHTRQVNSLGLIAGENLAARPGYSEHQTGLSADLAALTTTGKSQGCYIQICFSSTKAGKWLARNSYKYGFILRYEDGMTKVTGYQFEPWHFRYVGPELAAQYEAAGQQTFERFLGAPNAQNYFKNKKEQRKEPKRAWLY